MTQRDGKDHFSSLPSDLQAELERVRGELLARFGSNLTCLILYGSWVKGTARVDSDVDLVAVFRTLDKEIRKALFDLEMEEAQRRITIVSATEEEFAKEWIPLFTAVKREGKVLYGKVDLSLNPEPAEKKYRDFFERSRKFESEKVRVAEDLVDHELVSGAIELCYVAAKHTIQASLAMKGRGYSSKVAALLPLAQACFGKEVSETFKALFGLYVKYQYGFEFPSVDEGREAISYARKILNLYKTYGTSGPDTLSGNEEPRDSG